MRLIDADEMIKNLKAMKTMYDAIELDGMIRGLEQSKTIDAEPVVRCKDCKDYRNGICGKIEYIMDGYYHGTFEEKRPDDFCSYGEKKKRGKVHEAD